MFPASLTIGVAASAGVEGSSTMSFFGGMPFPVQFFLAFVIVGSVAQIFGNILFVHLIRTSNFTVVTTYGKIETVIGADLGYNSDLSGFVTNVKNTASNDDAGLSVYVGGPAASAADEVKIRPTAVYTGTPIMTTLSGAKAAALGIAALKKTGYAVKTVQEYH